MSDEQSQHFASSESSAARRRRRRRRARAPYIVAIFMALVAGLLGGYAVDEFLIAPIRPQTVLPSVLAEEDLDSLVGTYTYDGHVYGITARAAIEDSVRLSSRLTSDGTYEAPTADMIMAYARNRILTALADGAGVSVTGDEVVAYASDFMGLDDLSLIAQAYDMDDDQAYRLMEEAARVAKLRSHVVGAQEGLAAPELPDDGDTEVGKTVYASYIKSLLGEHWDFVADTWADTDNAYYEALQNMAFGGNLANYEAASAAYGIAVAEYVEGSAAADRYWRSYVDGYLDRAAITIGTLRA